MKIFTTCAKTLFLVSALIGPGLAGPVLAQDTAKDTAKDSTMEADKTLRPVKLFQVKPSNADLKRTFFGQIAALQTVDLAFQVGGKIEELPVLEGAVISKGDLIAQLDLRPFELARDQAVLQLDQANRTYDRLEKLRGGAASQVSIDDAETSKKLAAIALETAEINLSDATLEAPFDGIVASRGVANYTTVAAGTPVVRLHDMSEILVEINVPEVLVQENASGDDVIATAKFPTSDKLFPLTMREVKAEASAIGQTFQVTFSMQPEEGMLLLPGATVEVYAERTHGDTRLVVPHLAIGANPDGSTFAYRFTPSGADTGAVEKVAVTVEPAANGEMVVTSGLEADDEIVTAGLSRLKDGMAVRRFAGFAN